MDKLTYLDKYPDLDLSMSGSNIGARKKTNICDHLFIIYGVINAVIQGKDTCIDIQVYDLQQAFDALWLEDCLNDLYDSLPEHSRDDKLAMVYQTNVNNRVAVNTAVGQTERISIPRIVQQGGGWGPMECSNSVDKIGKMCKERGIHQYVYKKMVRVLPLACVDDLLGFAPCGNKSIALNTFINTHIEMKKLRFHIPDQAGKSKCHTLHVGKASALCPELRVHGYPMEKVVSDKYLGDIISSDGSNTENLRNRISIGNGVIAKIRSILENASLGVHYFKIAFLLRESLFLNGILYSSESWYGIKDDEVRELEKLDNILMRTIFEVPQSAPIVSLFLESGCIRIRNIIKGRRVNYLHQLANLDQSEMLYKFFKCQWDQPVHLDWTEQAKSDLSDLDFPASLEFLRSKSKNVFQKLVKEKIKNYEFCELLRGKRSKLENLNYFKLEMQEYLWLNSMNKKEALVLFKFRTRMAPFGENYKAGNVTTICPLCSSHTDSQEESFTCVVLNRVIKIQGRYSDIFGSKFPKVLIDTLYKIYWFREDFRKLK